MLSTETSVLARRPNADWLTVNLYQALLHRSPWPWFYLSTTTFYPGSFGLPLQSAVFLRATLAGGLGLTDQR